MKDSRFENIVVSNKNAIGTIIESDEIHIDSCIFEDNQANSNMISLIDSGNSKTVNFTNCIFYGNYATSDDSGGSNNIYMLGSKANFTNSKFSSAEVPSRSIPEAIVGCFF